MAEITNRAPDVLFRMIPLRDLDEQNRQREQQSCGISQDDRHGGKQHTVSQPQNQPTDEAGEPQSRHILGAPCAHRFQELGNE